MIRVALVISNLEFGGAQRQLVELVNASQNMDVSYCLVAMSDVIPLAGQLFDPDVVRVLNKRSRFDFTVVPRLARLFREQRIDVAHAFLFDAEIATRLAGTMASTGVVVGSERNVNYRIKRIQKIAYRLTHGMRDACIANSIAGARFNARELGYSSDHYRVVYNGVDTARFHPADRSAACELLGLDPAFRWVGMVGSFKRQKNHSVFLRAARRLLDERQDVRVVLVGDTLADGLRGTNEYKREIVSEIERLDFGDRIAMLGNREDIENVYPACDLTVLPSLHEGTPNVALESMACGTPVVASDVSDNSFVIPNGVAGFVVPLNDIDATGAAMLRCLDTETNAMLSEQARARAEKQFSTDAFARNMLEVYRELLG
ncbi:MAG: glycosyltransferase [Gammaproteobacteria bacterium]|nr:glycosyltransferase [Gammaproteobacteria bacterium]